MSTVNSGHLLDPAVDRDALSTHHGLANDILKPLLLLYIEIIKRRWIAITIAIVLCIAGSVVLTLTTPAQYTATLTMQIDRSQKRVVDVESIDPASDYDEEFYATQYELLKARSLAVRVARKLNLGSNEAFLAGHGIQTDSGQRGRRKPTASEESNEAAAGLLLGNIAIEPVRNSRLVSISYTSRSPAIAALVANTWAKEFMSSNLDRQFASTAEARKFLETRLEVLRERLQQSESDAVNYAAGKDIVKLQGGVDAEGRSIPSRTLTENQIAALDAELSSATAARIEARSKLAAKTFGSSDGAQGGTLLGSLRQRRAELETEYSKLLVQFEPEYAAARSVKQQIDSLDKSINAELNRIRQSNLEQFKAASDREAFLREQVSRLKDELQRQQKANIQFNIFERDADTNRQLYEAILQRYKEIGVAGTVGVNNVSIIDPAEQPGGPSSPNLSNNLKIGLLAGLVLAALVVFAIEQLDQGVRDPAVISKAFGIPLIGTAPVASNHLEGAPLDLMSELYEAYFACASNLALSTREGFPLSMMVTSAQKGEGKTTTTIALATILGRLGKRVLLIDADLRSPSLHSSLKIENKTGLSIFLAGGTHWRDYVVPTQMANVSALPCGPLPPNAPELLSSDRLLQLVHEAKVGFDHVIIDSPPVLGLSDALLISRSVDGTLFVVKARNASVSMLRDALARLRSAQALLIGGILTMVMAGDTSYGYGYSYGQGKEGKSKSKRVLKAQIKKKRNTALSQENP